MTEANEANEIHAYMSTGKKLIRKETIWRLNYIRG